jgi:glycosyltransferase involved in cell wall biosynthesis
MDILISVIIPNFNYEQFLKRCIDSVLNQNYENFEVIVVDDCSTDNSRELIKSYGNKIISVFPRENGGHGSAFNLGYEQSKGQLVTFIDADDYANQGWLSALAKAYEKDVAMYHYNINLVDVNEKIIGTFPNIKVGLDNGNVVDKILNFGRIKTTVTSGLCFSKTALEKVMPIDVERYRQGGDGYLSSVVPLLGNIKIVKGNLTSYRQHGLNHSQFDAALLKRALWCYKHNLERYSDIYEFSRRQNLSASQNLGVKDLPFLEQLLVINTFDGDIKGGGFCDLTRKQLYSFASDLIDTHYTYGKFTIKAWWFFSCILPKKLAKKLISWKLQASTRPRFLQFFIQTIKLKG